MEGGECPGRLLLARKNLLADSDKLRTHRWIGQCSDNGSIELVDRTLRRVLGSPQCLPGRHVETGQSCLVYGGDFGRCSQSSLRHYCIRLDCAGAYVRKRIGRQIEHEVDVPGDEVVDRPSGAPIGNDVETGPRLLLEKDTCYMGKAALAAAALRRLIRVGL